MKPSLLVAIVAICCVVSTAVGFAIGSAVRPDPARAASGNAAIVKQLKRLVERTDLGSISKDTTALGLLWEIKKDTRELEDLPDELYQITKNTYETCLDASHDVLCDF